ncbi:MAG: PDZ domain-containing protein [Candidatus Omnitrophota bacterium]
MTLRNFFYIIFLTVILSVIFSFFLSPVSYALFEQSVHYEYEFKSAFRGGFKKSNDQYGQTFYKDGAYHVIGKTDAGYLSFLLMTAITRNRDFSVEVTMRTKEGFPEQGFGFVWAVAPRAVEYYRFLISGNKQFRIDQMINGQPNVICDWTASDVLLRHGEYNTLAVVFKKDQGTFFFINRRQVFATGVLPQQYHNVGFCAAGKMHVEVDRWNYATLKYLPVYLQCVMPEQPQMQSLAQTALPGMALQQTVSLQSKYILGVIMETPSQALAKHLLDIGYSAGIYIKDIAPGSAAEKAGLQKEDIILNIDNSAVKTSQDVIARVNASNGKIHVTGVRQDQLFTKDIRLQRNTAESQELVAEQGVVIHDVKVNPGKVSPGEEFFLEIDYTAGDSALLDDILPIAISYAILKEGEIKYSKTTDFQASNGLRSAAKIGLTAAKQAGEYELQVTIKYGNAFAGRSAKFTIR